MTVKLCPILSKSNQWKVVRKYANEKMEERGYEDYTVKVRAAKPKEEGVIVFEDACVNVSFSKEDKEMYLIIGRGEEASPADNLEDPEDFAEYSILGFLDQFVYPDLDDDLLSDM